MKGVSAVEAWVLDLITLSQMQLPTISLLRRLLPLFRLLYKRGTPSSIILLLGRIRDSRLLLSRQRMWGFELSWISS